MVEQTFHTYTHLCMQNIQFEITGLFNCWQLKNMNLVMFHHLLFLNSF